MYFNLDDYNADKLFALYDRHMEFFDSLDEQMGGSVLDDGLTEPSEQELKVMDANADLLLEDILNDGEEDGR